MNRADVIAANLARWMEESPGLNTLTKVADKSGVGYGTIRRLRTGQGNPTHQNLEKVAQAFGRYVEDLLRQDLVLNAEPGQYKITGQPAEVAIGRAKVEIPMLATVASMGPGVTLDDDDTVVDRITVKREWLQTTLPGCRYDRLAVISGKGDSMEPTFSDGDLLLVDTSKTTVDIDGVYVLSAHKRLFIKSVRQRIDGSYEISSDNPKIKTVDVLNGDHEVMVHGRVVLVWGAKKL